MNKERRKKLEHIVGALDAELAGLCDCRDDERDYYDNMPESFQNGEKGQAADEAANELEEACDALVELMGKISELVQR